jgi:hypothetical protein
VERRSTPVESIPVDTLPVEVTQRIGYRKPITPTILKRLAEYPAKPILARFRAAPPLTT